MNDRHNDNFGFMRNNDNLMRQNPFSGQQIFQRDNFDFGNDRNNLQESIYVSNQNNSQNAPINNQNENALTCSCGQQYTEKQQILSHA